MDSQTSQKILAIETSGSRFSLAVAEGRTGGGAGPGSKQEDESFRLRGEILFNLGPRHSDLLKDGCSFLVEKCEWRKQDLDLLAVTTGPGGFTGLRIGISFARAMAQALDLPLIGMSSFEVLALGMENMKDGRGANSHICVLIDSIERQFFAGFFRRGSVKPLKPYRVLSIEQVCREVSRISGTLLAGEGVINHEDEIMKELHSRGLVRKAKLCPYEQNFPQARFLAKLAWRKANRSRPSPTSWRKVVPLYLRPPLAVERLNRGER